jgi:hypothetical protein
MYIYQENQNLVTFGQKCQGMVHEDQTTFYRCWRHEFAFKSPLYKAPYFYSVGSNVLFSSVQKMHACISTAGMV